MAVAREVPQLIAITPVKPDRRDDFERFVVDVLSPAIRQARPHLATAWQTLRPHADTDGCTYVFVIYGDASPEEWDLASTLRDAHGDEEGARLLAQFEDLLDGDQQAHLISGELGAGAG